MLGGDTRDSLMAATGHKTGAFRSGISFLFARFGGRGRGRLTAPSCSACGCVPAKRRRHHQYSMAEFFDERAGRVTLLVTFSFSSMYHDKKQLGFRPTRTRWAPGSHQSLRASFSST